MSEQNGHETKEIRENETNQNEGASWVFIREASALLGISERAVQMQAKSGKLLSRKSGGRWQVQILTQNEAQNETNESASRSENEETKQFRENETKNESALIEQMQSEIVFLRSELERRNEDVRRRDIADGEMRRLMLADRQEIAELRQRLALVAAPETLPESTQSRENAPAPREETRQHEPRRGLFQRWFGRRGR